MNADWRKIEVNVAKKSSENQFCIRIAAIEGAEASRYKISTGCERTAAESTAVPAPGETGSIEDAGCGEAEDDTGGSRGG